MFFTYNSASVSVVHNTHEQELKGDFGKMVHLTGNG
jgi:hypothetical protein